MSEIQKNVEEGAAQKLVSEFMRELPSDQLFDTREVVRTHPVIQNQPSAIVDLAYEEYSRRRRRGEEIDIEEFARQFPAAQATLLKLASLDKLFDQHAQSTEQTADSVWPAVGDNYLQFDLLEKLGGGKFSRVFLAREMDLGERTVVLKVCYTGEDEAQTLGRLQHPNIVPVNSVRHDFSTNLSAISLQFMGRSTLGDVLYQLFANGSQPKRNSDLVAAVQQINRRSETPLLPDAAEEQSADGGTYVDAVIRMGSQIASALAYSHSMGIFHGDIKPSNILVTGSGKSLLFDFNLAVNPKAGGGRVGGTLPYMAPEQLTPIRYSGEFSANTIDARTEIFSLGVTLYEALCGQHPFAPIPDIGDRQEFAAALLTHQQAGAKPLHELNPRVDPVLAALIDSALQLDPQLRPESADRFARDLSSLLAPHQRVRRSLVNHPRLTLAGVIVALAASVGGIAFLQSLPSQHERQMTRIVEAFDAEQYADVVAIADEVLATSPSCARSRYLKAQSLMEAGLYSEAAKEFETLHQQQPADDRWVKNMSYCLACLAALEKDEAASGYWGDAITALESIANDSATDASYYVNLGYCRFQIKRNKEAKAALESALQLDESLVRVHLRLAEIERQQVLSSFGGDWKAHLDLAEEHLESASDLASADRSMFVDFYYQQGITQATAAFITSLQDPALEVSSLGPALDSFETAVSRGLSAERLQKAIGVNQHLEDSAEFRKLVTQAESNEPADKRRWLMAPDSNIDQMLRKLPCR